MQRLTGDRSRKQKSDCFFYLFLPFVFGYFLARSLDLPPDNLKETAVTASLLLLLLCGSSVYGRFLTALLFLFFGSCAFSFSPVLSGVFAGTGHIRQRQAFFLCLIPAVFAAGEIGLKNARSLQSNFSVGGISRVKQSLRSSMLQLLVLLIPALISVPYHP